MKSIWDESCEFDKREELKGDIKTDILIIGAGITGILIGYFLKQSGREVVLIDKSEIARGNTRNTTAKITSQHDLIYNTLIEEFGEEKAKQYAYANELAIKKYEEIIKERKIDCDFEKVPAYIYSLNETDKIIKEVEAAKKLGIDAEFIIYENTRAIKIEENLVSTDKGNIIANHIVIATHYPIMNAPGYYFMKMHQERSYVIALENANSIEGMYIDYEKQGYSFRNYKGLLLLGGISQRTGENESGGSYDKLRKFAKEIYPNSKEKYHWSAQDCITIDGIPYIGRYSDSTPNIYVATGFNKWGMTSAMVSAMIISDLILGNDNNFSEIFSPKRFDLSLSINNIANDLVETAKNFIAQKISIPSSEIEHIKNGDAGIVEYNGQKVGVYKDKKGKEFIVSTKCAHLGCELHWNADELTWDCPCHGSRFDYKGNLIDSPAVKDIVED
ncbi:FAD-dependent oxidoreductase [Clostridium saudiense]|uniref:FAD-dependent oxidoreductase n=1 Tax=Clostridium saudiense TaxID=1414720 RepID=A0ABS2FHC0_9CLOT|nr:FAD-dependent oxidoreductase [Clostridium saudiense]MBM6819923.1 FAD-dependent oxidoreductase [Clostridium saudiense]